MLKDAGCSEIFLFGGAGTGSVLEASDIDRAMRGCPQGRFSHLRGRRGCGKLNISKRQESYSESTDGVVSEVHSASSHA